MKKAPNLGAGDAAGARNHYRAAWASPPGLGEDKHLLANHADIRYGWGCAEALLGDRAAAEAHWTYAAGFMGDFRDMSVGAFSPNTVYSAPALKRLGRPDEAAELLCALRAYAVALEATPAKIDYFATSLPALLLFEDDLNARRIVEARFLRAQAEAASGDTAAAPLLLAEILRRDPNHEAAAEPARAPAAFRDDPPVVAVASR